jgi:pyrroline-5-carboxylate reductase
MVKELLVMGGGKMGEALVRGMLDAGWASPEQVAVAEVAPARVAELTGEGGLASCYPGLQVVGRELPPAQGAVLAVKPADIEVACRNLEGAGVSRALSIAAGITLADLESFCPAGCTVVRAMPNIAALVRAGATAISPGSLATSDDLEWATGIMQSVGLVVEVPEKLLDAVTGLSGSGPAYVFLMVEAMTEAGVLVGLPRTVARDLVVQTLLGSAQLLSATGQSAEELRAAVTSPGGTTAAGLRRLEAEGARSAFIEAVAAATARSRELGASPSSPSSPSSTSSPSRA